MKFLCDGMLGTLCKYLRICGLDAAYSNEGLGILVRARAEDRVILTRNTRLKDKRGVFFLVSEQPLEQLRAVREKFKVPDRLKFLTRCLVCNEPLVPIDREAIRDRVPYYTYKKFNGFAECPDCRKVYWRGSHYLRMMEQLKRIVPIGLVVFWALTGNCVQYLMHQPVDRQIRVAVVCAVDSVTVTGINQGKYYENHGVSLRDPSPQFFEPKAGRVLVNGIPYRGRLEIRRNDDALWVINILDLEDYLKGVVPCEIGGITRNLLEAAKAQAVAARTYAVSHRHQNDDLGFDLYSTVQDQVYGGIPVEVKLIDEAVERTRGQVLTDLGRPIDAKYHSTCGGQTADFDDAWAGAGPPYLRSVPCGWCRSSPHYEWKKGYLKKDFFADLRSRLKRLGIILAPREFITGMNLVKNRLSHRIRQVKIRTTKEEYAVSVYNIRTLLGDQRDPGGLLKSNWFTLTARGDSVFVEGRGFGHGVGMCQWGCLGMARNGKDYRQILRLYYPGTRLKTR